ncbi:hypothetical protein [Hwanghaeella sp. LZ110]|uniref:hypothetical protein n=1 Tax=Hwanghaeella sp. LZ110 TaxID=3402810 RepID=UPI003B66F31B
MAKWFSTYPQMDGLSGFAKQSAILAEQFRPYTKFASQMHQRLRPTFEVAEQLHIRIAPIFRVMEPLMQILSQMGELFQTPQFRRYASVERSGTILHPIYIDLFEPDFTSDDVRSNWRRIRARLWARFPDSLDTDTRKSRYKEFLTCQTQGAYVAVCRSIYAELEALIREEVLFSDPEWWKALQSELTASARRGKLGRELGGIVKSENQDFPLVNLDQPISPETMCAVAFVNHLEKAFDSFDPTNVDSKPNKAYRHLHAHGWIKEASFMDSLNGLLAYDYALQQVAVYKTARKANYDTAL